MSDILFETISYHDYHENYYHAFITGLFSGLGYSVKSNQENGMGRTDIVVRDKKCRRAMIIEAKKARSMEDLERACLEGRQQIIDKQYSRGLGGFTAIVCYGVSFWQKTALVRRLEV